MDLSRKSSHLLDIEDDPQHLQDLRLELAAFVDAGVYFVKATYHSKGDGPSIFSCYEKLSAVSQVVVAGHYPNTTAVAREIASGNAVLKNNVSHKRKYALNPACIWFAAEIQCPVSHNSQCL